MRILFGRKSSEDVSLFEDILRTNNEDHAAFISKIWELFDLSCFEEILTTVSLLICINTWLLKPNFITGQRA